MKYSENWLREWVNPDVSTEQLSHQLTMAGLEVDAVEPVAAALDKVVVGRVISLEPHPDANKLKVCQVDVGADALLNIVCGASNVEQDGRYPVATVGAQLPGGIKIKKAKLRGVPSFGMLCSATELGMAEQADGLLPLPGDAPVGEAVSEYLQLNDNSIELGLTPNRADCLSIRGVAREVGVINRKSVNAPKIAETAAKLKDELSIELKAAEQCPHYVGRIIKGINPKAQTPMWMQEKLRRSGVRSISPVVDVTNYVLLELGQPMHAFDLDKLSGGIVVRMAKKGEKITLLDGQEIELAADNLVIADHKQAQALAGIMGGNDSAVDESTTNIFLESAFFSPEYMAGKARRFGLHTDSSHRFERGVDPQLQKQAVDRATQLLLELVGGEASVVSDVSSEKHLPQRVPIELRAERIARVLGVTVEAHTVTDILRRLEMEVTVTGHQWHVTPPSFRFDIETEIDLIEEVARIYGYAEIPSSSSKSASHVGKESENHLPLRRFRDTLVARGYQEAITYSFVDPDLQILFDNNENKLALTNPISAEMSEMRTSLWPGLVQAALYNINRQQETVRLFESGLRFLKSNDDINQEAILAGLHFGSAWPEQWGEQQRSVDFFDVKNTTETLLKLSGEADTFIYRPDKHLALHPGQCARIVKPTDSGEETVGWLGALHPELARKLDLAQPLYLFELRLDSVSYRQTPKFCEISKFPAIRRDLAIVVDEKIREQAVSDCIKRATPSILKTLKLFDVYSGERIESGKKSLAYGLVLQNQERTLTDEEVDSVLSEIMSILNKELNATLRE
ncbi:MAG: phenylalanine--tRNA ligase subunit beta [Gammaproteobacteria bacterium]|nr:phenylalanine--tRNA ligase subunit beta [Gammaproteobacteria bacterium]MDH5802075.1 phenylalanine--tRNA ligase subunit beta [Gammaproteobacteria bacterium]